MKTVGSFDNIEGNFNEYTGLIYDGAFSEHMTSPERKGLTGEDIDENRAREIAKEFTGAEDRKNRDKRIFRKPETYQYTILK